MSLRPNPRSSQYHRSFLSVPSAKADGKDLNPAHHATRSRGPIQTVLAEVHTSEKPLTSRCICGNLFNPPLMWAGSLKISRKITILCARDSGTAGHGTERRFFKNAALPVENDVSRVSAIGYVSDAPRGTRSETLPSERSIVAMNDALASILCDLEF